VPGGALVASARLPGGRGQRRVLLLDSRVVRSVSPLVSDYACSAAPCVPYRSVLLVLA
jgi:hypothetical protein